MTPETSDTVDTVEHSAPPGSPTGRGASFWLLGAVFLGGAGTMVVELSAVRLLAPWFGSSNAVWTHAIGVILLALAIGYQWGGSLSKRADPVRAMGGVLILAAVWCSLLPWLTPVVAGWFMPEGVSLHGASGLLFWGSLASSTILFVPPALLLGCVAPIAVELLARSSETWAGKAGGRVLGLSTFGSLVGTFATTYWLIPTLGLRLTFGLASGLLLLAACLLFWQRSRLVGLVGLLLLPWFGMQRLDWNGLPRAEGELLAQSQSAYQWIRVMETGTGENRLRKMVVNEALDSYQSVWKPKAGLLGGGHYYDYFAAPMHWEAFGREAREQETWKLLVLGLGAGTAVRVLEGVMPAGMTLETVGVEIDPEIVRLGIEYFDLESNATDRRVLSGLDARHALRSLARDFDQIIVDAYANNVEIPAHLCTVEFFREVSEHLRPGGWVTLNLSGFGHDDPVVSAVSQTLANGLSNEVFLPLLPFSRNAMAFVRKGGGMPRPNSEGFSVGPDGLKTALSHLCLPSQSAWVAPGGKQELTDDHCPMLKLQRDSIARGVEGWLSESSL